jgi:hypothetical protein
LYNNNTKKKKNVIQILSIITALSLNGLIIYNAYSISKASQNYQVGYADGCQVDNLMLKMDQIQI